MGSSSAISCERARSGEAGHESLTVGGQRELGRGQDVYIFCVFVVRRNQLISEGGLGRYEVKLFVYVCKSWFKR